MSISHRIVTIPRPTVEATQDYQLIALAQKFRQFRLLALRDSPGAFASTYEEEAGRGLDQTLDRLKNTKATQFLALEAETTTYVRQADQPGEASFDDLLQHDWLGVIVLIGLHDGGGSMSAKSDPFDQIAKATEEMIEVEEGKTLHFHLNGMFVRPSARRSGLGANLIHAALARAESESANSGRGFACTIIVDEWNKSARDLYAKCGFQAIAKETYGSDRVAIRMRSCRR